MINLSIEGKNFMSNFMNRFYRLFRSENAVSSSVINNQSIDLESSLELVRDLQTLPILSSNENIMKNNFTNLNANFKNALSDEQMRVAHQIYHYAIGSGSPKLLQIISQPQAGKTNTILYGCGLINNHSELKDRNYARILYFQPSDNELKDQIVNRFNDFEYHSTATDIDPSSNIRTLELYTCNAKSVYTPANMTLALSKKLSNSLNLLRDRKNRIVFIHDESHRDVGEKGILPNFYEKNNIFLIPANYKNYMSQNMNIEREMYINISASPSSFTNYMQNAVDNNLNIPALYIKPHDNYLSFKNIKEQKRFRGGFNLNTKDASIPLFILEILCGHFLLGKTGSLIVRLGKGNGSVKEEQGLYDKIKKQINDWSKDKTLLRALLEKYLANKTDSNSNLNLTAQNIQTILENFDKLNCLLFCSNGSQPIFTSETSDKDTDANDKVLKLPIISTDGRFDISSMNLFLKQITNTYQVLFIMDSFLQGKTLDGLENVRGWFERFNEDPYNNNAFTIQSIGRNCGPYKNKNFTYPIWVNIHEMDHIISYYDALELALDPYTGFIDPNIWNDPSFKSNSFITNTYVKIKTKSMLRKQSNALYTHQLSSKDFDVAIFSEKCDADEYVHRTFELNHGINLEELIKNTGANYSMSSVYNNTSNDVIKDIIDKNYSRYNKIKTLSGGYYYGLFYIDSPNQNHKSSWEKYIDNDPSSIIYKKQGHYIAYVSRNAQQINSSINNAGLSPVIDKSSGWSKI